MTPELHLNAEPRSKETFGWRDVLAATAGVLVVTGGLALVLWRVKRGGQKTTSGSSRGGRCSSITVEGREILPPLPAQVVALLQSTRLCHLSTTDGLVPHLSLMNFTYYQAEEKIIMTTRRDTLKFTLLQNCPKCAVLVHDFPAASSSSSSSPSSPPSSGGHTYSITLVGSASIHEAGAEAAERYRSLHLQHNPDYAQFIVGPHIAVLTVQVESARICDVLDKVTYWEKAKRKQQQHTGQL